MKLLSTRIYFEIRQSISEQWKASIPLNRSSVISMSLKRNPFLAKEPHSALATKSMTIWIMFVWFQPPAQVSFKIIVRKTAWIQGRYCLFQIVNAMRPIVYGMEGLLKRVGESAWPLQPAFCTESHLLNESMGEGWQANLKTNFQQVISRITRRFTYHILVLTSIHVRTRQQTQAV